MLNQAAEIVQRPQFWTQTENHKILSCKGSKFGTENSFDG